ncbi:two-component system sensor histidine kinase/response regulator [Burkholderia contaminans]|nr:two-component system sensor histidine kinase/response regulator [Burkholderia contaminans]
MRIADALPAQRTRYDDSKMALQFSSRKRDKMPPSSATGEQAAIGVERRRHRRTQAAGIGIVLIAIAAFALYVNWTIRQHVKQQRDEAIVRGASMGRDIGVAANVVDRAIDGALRGRPRGSGRLRDSVIRSVERERDATVLRAPQRERSGAHAAVVLPPAVRDGHVARFRHLDHLCAEAEWTNSETAGRCYYVSLDGRFLGASLPSGHRLSAILASPSARSAFIHGALADVEPPIFRPSGDGDGRHPRSWARITTDSPAGTTVVRIGVPVADADRWVAVVFVDLDVAAMAATLAAPGLNGPFLLSASDGRLVTFAPRSVGAPSRDGDGRPTATRLVRSVAAGIPQRPARDDPSASIALGHEDLTLAYAMSWRDAIRRAAPAIAIAAFVEAAVLATVWAVLRRRQRTPAHADGRAHTAVGGEKPAVASNDARAQRLALETSVFDHADARGNLLVASIAHEIRTPLNAIVGHLELARREVRADHAQLDRLDVISDAAHGLLATLDDMLELSRIEAGEMSLRDDPFDVVDVYERALAIFSPLAESKGIAFHGHFDLQMNARVLGDAGRLSQIVDNLLSNALKFTTQGKVTIGFRGEPTICEAAQNVTTLIMTVEDTGIGIPASKIDRLFQPFARTSEPAGDRCPGTGLGLALCRRLAALMGGSIDVDSTPGQGSRFVVRISLRDSLPVPAASRVDGEAVVLASPMAEWRSAIERYLGAWNLCVSHSDSPAEVSFARIDRNPIVMVLDGKNPWPHTHEDRLIDAARHTLRCVESGPMEPQRAGGCTELACHSLRSLADALSGVLVGDQIPAAYGGPDVSGARASLDRPLSVLVVDDNPVNRHLLDEQLHTLGCRVVTAHGGRAALKMFDDHAFDVVLTDVCMPDMSGHELARALRAGAIEVPIYALTARPVGVENRRCVDVGIDKVVTKPLSLDRLYGELEDLANNVGAALVHPSRVAAGASTRAPVHLRNILLESTGVSFSKLRAASRQRDREAALAELHALKGCFGLFPAPALRRQLACIEADVAARGIAALDHLLEPFEAAYWEATKSI